MNNYTHYIKVMTVHTMVTSAQRPVTKGCGGWETILRAKSMMLTVTKINFQYVAKIGAFAYIVVGHYDQEGF